MKKKIIFTDIYSWDEFLSLIPFDAQDIYDIHIGCYGFLHDVGTEIVLTRSRGEASGWETAKHDFKEACDHCSSCWEINDNFGYH